MASTEETSLGPGLVYDEVLDEFADDFESNFQANVSPTGMGLESENPIVREKDGVMPLADEFQQILSEGLWESIEDNLEENVDGYGEDFSFELKGIKEKGHFEDESNPVEMDIEAKEDTSGVIDAPVIDWDLGPQKEIDSGAYEIEGNGDFGLVLDVLTSIKQGTRDYLESEHPELEFADQGLTRQFRKPEEVPDDIDGREVIKKGIGEEYDREDTEEFVNEFYDHFSSVEYYSDYIWTIFGPQIMENMFGGSTQLTSGLWHEDEGEMDIDDRMSEEMAYRIVFEGAFDVLTSNVYEEENGESERQIGVNQDYWEDSAYVQHFTNDPDIDEDPLERTGTPWGVVEAMMDQQEPFKGMIDHYMSNHNMAWIAPPGQEYIDIEGEVPEDFDYEDVTLLTVDPENPKTPKDYIEDGEVSFTKVVKDENGGLKRVNGTVDLSGMEEEELKSYHKANFSEAHIGGLHHDVRPKFGTGGFEYRNSRQNYEAEPNAALAKAAIMPHADKIVDAFEEYVVHPAVPETVPDFDDRETWSDIFEEVYDEEVMETAREMAPEYADEFEAYVNERLSEP